MGFELQSLSCIVGSAADSLSPSTWVQSPRRAKVASASVQTPEYNMPVAGSVPSLFNISWLRKENTQRQTLILLQVVLGLMPGLRTRTWVWTWLQQCMLCWLSFHVLYFRGVRVTLS